MTPNARPRRRRSRHAGPRRPWLSFYLITSLLICAVALIAVPLITRVIDSMRGFDPVGYDPKDFARSKAVTLRGVSEIFSGAEAYFSIAFLLLCVVFFMRSRRD